MNAEFLSNLIITKVYSATTLYSPKDAKAKRYDRPCWAIVIKYEGETVYTSGGKSIVSDASHVAILPKGCSYEWHCTKAGHFAIIEFESAPENGEVHAFAVKDGDRMFAMFKELERKRNQKAPLIELQSIRDTYSLVLAIVQATAERYLPTEKQRRIAPAIEYISEHYRETITNDMLASVTGLSTVYFRKLFTSLTGISPIAYVHRFRMEKAKDMLHSDYGTLTDVALSLGYISLYDFSRAFKKHTGIAPSKYIDR